MIIWMVSYDNFITFETTICNILGLYISNILEIEILIISNFFFPFLILNLKLNLRSSKFKC